MFPAQHPFSLSHGRFAALALSFCIVCNGSLTNAWSAEPAEEINSAETETLAGHSFHGEVFNEGPRQAAYLMPGLGHVEFPVSTESELAQRFILQGIAQLHGFWYYEAERSFRQAAVHDPECAMSYWGMAMANVGNLKRARDFIAQAVSRKDSATKREQRYIEAYEKFCLEEDDKGKKFDKSTRAKNYSHDLEEIVLEFPDDIEAKAFLALQLWQNDRADLPLVGHVAVDRLLQDVFDATPMHPAHHYRIHLWDKRKPEMALASAASCGQSLPAIAHMWHMPGHIYSKLHRYQDAVWQQEASARVDHAHMMRDRVLPDQIHNFAHNNEWLIRNLIKIGRVQDALDLAKNMLELPRHPKYNTLTKGSTKLGRERLLLTLSTYRLWPELIELSGTMYLEPTDDAKAAVERMRYLGLAYALSGQRKPALEIRATLESDLAKVFQELAALPKEEPQEPETTESGDDGDEVSEDDNGETEAQSKQTESLSKADAQKAKANRERRRKERAEQKKQLEDSQKQHEKAIATLQAALAAAEKDWENALKYWKDSDLNDNLLKAEWLAASGQSAEALKLIEDEIEKNPNEVPSWAVKSWLHFTSGGSEDAREAFQRTSELAATADLDTPLLNRLLPLAAELDVDADWAAKYEPAPDTGKRPKLDTLGPFRWHPYLAPDFVVQDTQEQTVRLKQFSGKPNLVIFYLGFGCLHCVEQLHAFSPRVEEFRDAGINVLAISTETVASLNTALSNYSNPLKIPLHADPELTAFRAYRCFDDFEQQPLHGTFLIAPDGRVLWQDISYEPFMDVDFALAESQRLLELNGFGGQPPKPKAAERLTKLAD